MQPPNPNLVPLSSSQILLSSSVPSPHFCSPPFSTTQIPNPHLPVTQIANLHAARIPSPLSEVNSLWNSQHGSCSLSTLSLSAVPSSALASSIPPSAIQNLLISQPPSHLELLTLAGGPPISDLPLAAAYPVTSLLVVASPSLAEPNHQQPRNLPRQNLVYMVDTSSLRAHPVGTQIPVEIPKSWVLLESLATVPCLAPPTTQVAPLAPYPIISQVLNSVVSVSDAIHTGQTQAKVLDQDPSHPTFNLPFLLSPSHLKTPLALLLHPIPHLFNGQQDLNHQSEISGK